MTRGSNKLTYSSDEREEPINESVSPPPIPVKSIQRLAELVLGTIDIANGAKVLNMSRTNTYTPKPVRAIQIRCNYLLDGAEIPSGSYLVEASGSDGNKHWVPFQQSFFESEYTAQQIERRASSLFEFVPPVTWWGEYGLLTRLLEAIQRLLLERRTLPDLVEFLERWAERGNKVILYNPEVEDSFLCSPKGAMCTIPRKQRERLELMAAKVDKVIKVLIDA